MRKDWSHPMERRNRTRKVRALCRAVRDLGRRNGAQAHQLAHWIDRAGPDVRASVAQLASVTTPSASTWRRVTHSLRTYRSR